MFGIKKTNQKKTIAPKTKTKVKPKPKKKIKALFNAEGEKCFWLCDGQILKNLKDLVKALETFIKEDKEPKVKPKESKAKRKKKLSVSKGRLYTYRIFKDDYADNLLIDCGFNIYKESELASFKKSTTPLPASCSVSGISARP